MLAYLGRALQTLAVAGTHGKTTTSSMLASVLDGMGEDPTFLIGGIVRAYGTNAHSGTGAHYVVEADESDKSFMHLSPRAVLVTNIEADHLDHYRDLDEIYEKFASFIGVGARRRRRGGGLRRGRGARARGLRLRKAPVHLRLL